eukprot:PhM_4_TR10432/c0_g1_i1/m.48050
MFFRTLRFLDFRTTKVSELSTQLLKRNMQFDHVAIDVGEFISNALRTRDFKDLSAEKKAGELVKHVHNNVSNVLKKVQPKRSVALMFDGAEPLWKMRKMRRRTAKKFEARHQRAAGQSLVFAVEDRLRQTVFDRDAAREIVFSGCNCPGPVEAKMSSWALDLAARPDTTINDTVCLLGSTDLFSSTLALTPLHNIYAIKFDMGDFKCWSMPALLDWLDVYEYLEIGDLPALTRLRRDMSFLMLLVEGLSITDLSNVTNITAKEIFQAYHDTHIASGTAVVTEEGGALWVDVDKLEALLLKVCRRPISPRADTNVGDYLEVLLQSHSMISLGGVRDYSYTLHGAYNNNTPPPTVKIDTLIAHLKSLKTRKIKAQEDTNEKKFVMSPAEYAIGVAPTAYALEEAVKMFTGQPMPDKLDKEVLECEDTHEAAVKIREMMSEVKKSQHRALSVHPSHCWVKTANAAGPPPGYLYWPVQLGEYARKTKIREKRAESVVPVGTLRIERSDMPMFHTYDANAYAWVETDPYTSTPEKIASLRTVRLATWNVQFDRHSGKDTPLGKPGIDWCSKTRYIALAKEIHDADLDIICMQESEVAWWEYLARQKWVQDNFYLSCGANGESVKPWGTLLLVNKRLPTTSLALTNCPGYHGHISLVPCVSFNLTETSVMQCLSIHLLAPYNKNNVDVRVTQTQNLVKRIDRYASQPLVVMGDFNDHPSNMFSLPPQQKLVDAWTSVHGTDSEAQVAGYTINGDLNTYCNLLIETEFFGRADRMYFRSDILKPTKSELIGTRSVKQVIPGIDCPDYLFPSDHFGVITEFDVVKP